jgi:hypothetical protein
MNQNGVMRLRYAKNPELFRKRSREYKNKHPLQTKEKMSKWILENKEYTLSYAQRYYRQNRLTIIKKNLLKRNSTKELHNKYLEYIKEYHKKNKDRENLIKIQKYRRGKYDKVRSKKGIHKKTTL